MGLLKTAAKVAVASSVHGRVQRRQQARWAAEDDGARAAVPAVSTAPAPGAAPDTHQLMAALTQLRAAGAVTDAEFADISGRIFG